MRVGIVGAGVGGMSLAAQLARDGCDVEIFDSGVQPGGKMSSTERILSNGETAVWDTGPTLLSLPDEIEKTFRLISVDSVPVPRLLPLQEGSHLLFADGTDWRLPVGREPLTSYFRVRSPRAAEALGQALRMAEDLFTFAEQFVLDREPPSEAALALRGVTSGLALRYPELRGGTSYAELVRRLFPDTSATSCHLREFFYHFGSYVGIHPEIASAALISVAHVELNRDVVFPEGGVYRIASYLADTCAARGVRRTAGRAVRSARPIGGSESRNKGWEVTVDKEVSAKKFDALVIATDPHQALLRWLDAPTTRAAWTAELDSGALRPSESQLVILLEWRNPVRLAHHTKLFPASWLASFRTVCEDRRLPDDPCCYLVWPHATDPGISKHALFISAMAPNTTSGVTWDEATTAGVVARVLAQCERRLGFSLAGDVVRVVTPAELESRTGSLAGGLYGATPSKLRRMFFHPAGASRAQNLFFAGGATHPGAGIPMVMRGARRIAERIRMRGTP